MSEDTRESGASREDIAQRPEGDTPGGRRNVMIVTHTLTARETFFIGRVDISEHDDHVCHLRLQLLRDGVSVNRSGRRPNSNIVPASSFWLTPCMQGRAGDAVEFRVWTENGEACNVRAEIIISSVFIEATRAS